MNYLLIPYINKIESILPWDEMKLPARVDVMKKILSLFKAAERSAQLLSQVKRFLGLFKTLPKDEILKYKQDISDAIIEVIKDDALLFDLGEIINAAHIQNVLEEIGGLKQLYLGILTGNVKEAEALFSQTQSLLKCTNVDIASLKDKIRYSKMVSLADEHKKLTFKELTTHLDCDIQDIEILFINAIELGFLEVIIDQANEIVYFG